MPNDVKVHTACPDAPVTSLFDRALKNQNYYDLVSNLIIYHYDKAYKKTRAESSTNIISTINLEKITKTSQRV